MNKLTSLLLAALLVMLSACTTPRGAAIVSEVVREKKSDSPTFQVVEVNRERLPSLAKWPANGWHGHYHWLKASRGSSSNVIRSGDTVDLIIWDSEENSLLTGAGQKSTEMRGLNVSSSGTIFVPYLDEVLVRGQTPNDARRSIQSKLTQISPSAQVQLMFTPGLQNSVDLVTGVGSPGSYPLPNRNFTILSLISLGGGIDLGLRNPLVRLIRGSKTYEIRAEELFETQSKNVTLRGGDKVLVREDDRYFTALGATGTEEIVYFDKEHITTIEALSMLGGLNDNAANLKGVLVLREYPAKNVGVGLETPDLQQVVFVFDLTNADGLFAARSFEVQPNDTVLATESVVSGARKILSLIGTSFGVVNAATN
ncbi:polysaccharide biosynthesis/export family protein [Lentibacter algarum]|uniref:polysaccharide biosynthesis/export family protein n=1 Tax=Lentibacter algarum TaxID=576131 RepID=UPI00339D83BD